MPYADLEKQKAYRTAYRITNRYKLAAKRKAYYRKNRAVILARRVAWGVKNKEKIRSNNVAYRQKNKEKLLAQLASRYKTDSKYRLRKNLANRILQILQGKSKSARTMKLIGCSIEFLRQHLEKQFVPGMTWENYGPVWHVDHILPCAEFHLQHSEEQEICFHWTNLQPLFAAENLSKGDRII